MAVEHSRSSGLPRDRGHHSNDSDGDSVHTFIAHLSSLSGDSPRRESKRAGSQIGSLRAPETGDYYRKAIDNPSTLPYHYPPTIRIHKEVQEFDASVMPEQLLTSGDRLTRRQISPRIRRFVRKANHNDGRVEFSLSQVADSFAARCFKRFLKQNGT
jgi:hypothetical protein